MYNIYALVDKILGQHDNDAGNLIMIMQDLQMHLNYLPPEAINYLSQKLNLPRAQIYAVSSFYKSFSLKPRGKHKIDLCEGTACHIKGAALLMSQIADELGIAPGETTKDGEVTLNSVHCVGACAMGPVAVIDGTYYGDLTAARLSKLYKECCSAARACSCPSDNHKVRIDENIMASITDKVDSSLKFEELQARLRQENPIESPGIIVCSGTGCLAKGSLQVAAALRKELAVAKVNLQVTTDIKTVGCHGLCEMGPLVILHPENICYTKVSPDHAESIIRETVVGKKIIEELLYREPKHDIGIEKYTTIPFYAGQKRNVLRNVGTIDPRCIADYIIHGGYSSLLKALYTMKPDQVIDEIDQSGLRGRGGGGFPTGEKWKAAASVKFGSCYVICNGDEGDPGAFMDCSIMEGDPHAIIEGMVICAYAVGAAQGFIYVREEYPRALERLQTSIEQARQVGFLGQNIGGTSFSFDIKLNRGAGAFVCGESTALMQSIEGKVGEPRAKYVHSAARGLYNQPTVLNNVETFANVPLIIEKGAAWFATIGTANSKGTKVFSVVGKVRNTGLVEVPMGTSLRNIIFDICGGIPDGKTFKAVQTGGPSGGCLPSGKLDLPVDFDSLTQEGSMMGSGGMIVMDESTCMVDVARYFINFLTQESCGKCAACRLGLASLHLILDNICQGKGQTGDIERIEKLLSVLENGALCGLGKSAPNPVRSTLTHFKDEYLAHIVVKKCPAGVCRNLISYKINTFCTGCRLCSKSCPKNAITGVRKKMHSIDQALCNRCGICKATCTFNAVTITS